MSRWCEAEPCGTGVRCSTDWIRGRPMSSLRWPRNVLSINNLVLYLRNISRGEGMEKELQTCWWEAWCPQHDCLQTCIHLSSVIFLQFTCTLLVCSYYTLYFLIFHTTLPLTSSFILQDKNKVLLPLCKVRWQLCEDSHPPVVPILFITFS